MKKVFLVDTKPSCSKDGVYYGASETRKDGQAAGY
jgi:hypothetical protein